MCATRDAAPAHEREPASVALAAAILAAVLVAGGCGSGRRAAATTTAPKRPPPVRRVVRRPRVPRAPRVRPGIAQRVLGLPPIPHGPLPGYLLIADRDNNRAIIVSPTKRIVWERGGLRGPDDTFFTPGYRTVITNEEFNDTLTEVALRSRRTVWRYGHDAVPGSSPGYLDAPDDAYRLPNGDTTIADIRNCRIVQLTRSKRIRRILGGSCVHDPPRGFSSPNGDTPLPDGGLLVTEIGGWIDRLARDGSLRWSLRSPVSYPSDAQLLPNGDVLVSGFTNPGRIVEVTRSGRVVWSFGASTGPDELDRPSLALRLPNGFIASNDDWNHRVIVIDPRTRRIVWQYGHTGVAGRGAGYLDKPDGLDLLPSAFAPAGAERRAQPRRTPTVAPARPTVRRIGTLPATVSKAAAVALAGGKLVVLGGIGSDRILAGTPSRLRLVGHLPVPTHDAAAVRRGGFAVLYGGGEATSTPAVVRVDPATGAARTLPPLDEPLSDLGAATIGGETYLVGGYTGSRYASAILRVRADDTTTTVGRLPLGLRYAGVAAYDGRIYVAGGVTTHGPSDLVQLFDPPSREVRTIARLPRAAAHVALAAAGDHLYLVGGGSRSVYEVPSGYGSVRRVGTLPQALTDPSAVSLGGKAIVLGGGTNAVYELSAPRNG